MSGQPDTRSTRDQQPRLNAAAMQSVEVAIEAIELGETELAYACLLDLYETGQVAA